MRHEVVKNLAVIEAYVHIVGGSKDKDNQVCVCTRSHTRYSSVSVLYIMVNSL